MDNLWETLHHRVSLSGMVCEPNGTRMAGAMVSLQSGPKKKKNNRGAASTPIRPVRTRTKPNGCFAFVDLPPGNYRLSVDLRVIDATSASRLQAATDVVVDPIVPSARPLPPPPFVRIDLVASPWPDANTIDAGSDDSRAVTAAIDRGAPGIAFVEWQ